MENIIIKEINENKMEEAIEMIWKTFLEFEAPDYTQEGIDEFCKCIHDEEWIKARKFLGAFDENDKVIGAIATKDKTHIALYFVDGAYHKQGIGRKLYNAVSYENTSGFFTVNSSPYAHEIYIHYGFVDTEDTVQCVNGLLFYPMKNENIGELGLERPSMVHKEQALNMINEIELADTDKNVQYSRL